MTSDSQLFRGQELGIQRTKLAACLAAITLFVFFLLATYVIHARYLPVDVVFYSALQDVAFATVVSAIILWLAPGFRVLGVVEKLQLLIIWLLAGYAFAISIPTVIDRSLSFYLLEKIDQRGGGVRQDALHGIITQEFMHEYRVVDARLTEQLESGTLIIKNGCVLLTDKGHRIASASRTFRAELLPKHRQLMGVYSDTLTNPLISDRATGDYRCQ